MVRRALLYLWQIRAQAIKYAAVGGSSFVLDIGSLIALKELGGLSPVFAVVLSQVVIVVYGFLCNKYWTFQNTHIPHWQFLRYTMLAAWNYAFSVTAMYFFQQLLGYQYLAVRICSIAVMVSWNFFLYKYWVYKQ